MIPEEKLVVYCSEGNITEIELELEPKDPEIEEYGS